MTQPSAGYGVHSEVGRLRNVLVCAPGLAHERLTPTNCDDLLFDDVLWVENAQRDHADFVNKLGRAASRWSSCTTCSAETLAIPEARDWLLDRKVTAEPGRNAASIDRHARIPRVAGRRPARRAADRRHGDLGPARGLPLRRTCPGPRGHRCRAST